MIGYSSCTREPPDGKDVMLFSEKRKSDIELTKKI